MDHLDASSRCTNEQDLSIMLNISKIEDALVVEESVFDGMTNLQLLRWDYCPLRVWPSTFSTKFLVELIMRGSKFEKLWEGIQSLKNLKRMDLSDARSFQISQTPLTSSHFFSRSARVYWKFLPLLETSRELILSGCSRLKTFPEITTNIQELNLSSTAIEEMPSSLRLWSCLYKLEMQRCRSLKVFPPVPEGIEELDLSDTLIEEVPPWIENLSQLRHLAMFRCWKLDNVSLSRISKMVGVSCMHIIRGDKDTSRLHQTTSSTKTAFTIYECRSLVSLPQPQDSLSSLDAENCVSLETIDGSFHNPDIRLNFLNCVNLNHEARELIQTSRHLPMFLKFKACLLMIDDEGDVDEEDDDYDEEVIFYGDYDTYPHSDHYKKQDTMRLSCRVDGKQNGVHDYFWVIKECGLQLLELPHVHEDD
ncbi:hypothetical protein F2Q69_00042785 [Brassica cretica]|uniref:Uncharacterized protein n=1 Tax=Brassica cretica TaxID=69181 RepID=A0A8S9NC60_BRACR|nr:hypothetical protein F2Q69_00042785 [Brassica cretica]